MAETQIRVPAQAKRGEVIEIRALMRHPMETGHRHDQVGKPIPRHIVESFVCTYNGAEIFRVKLFPGISANPYFAFFTTATESGELVFTWIDDRGQTSIEKARIEVAG